MKKNISWILRYNGIGKEAWKEKWNFEEVNNIIINLVNNWIIRLSWSFVYKEWNKDNLYVFELL